MIQSYIRKPTIPNFYVPSFCRGLWIFDSTTNKIIDYSQYQNHGTNKGSTPKGYSNLFNGINNYVSLPNSTSLDITSAPLAIFATIRVKSGASAGYILCKNLLGTSDIQYAIYFNGTNVISSRIDTVQTNSSSIFLTEKWFNVGVIWDGANINMYINFNQSGTPGSFTGTLTSVAVIQIGRREVNGAYLNADIANVSVYASSDANEIIKHQKILSKQFNIRR